MMDVHNSVSILAGGSLLLVHLSTVVLHNSIGTRTREWKGPRKLFRQKPGSAVQLTPLFS